MSVLDGQCDLAGTVVLAALSATMDWVHLDPESVTPGEFVCLR